MTNYFDINPALFGGSVYNNSEPINYCSTLADLFLSSTVTPASKKIQKNTVPWSNYNTPVDYSPDRIAGYSRNHGDASSAVQMRVMQKILDASSELQTEDRALLLAFARVESGFNPDAAATSTSASGVFQFINSTGNAFGLNAYNRFDADANINAGVQLYKENLKILDKKYPELVGSERAVKLYALHHDGPSLQYGGEVIAKKEVVPYLERFLTIAESYDNS